MKPDAPIYRLSAICSEIDEAVNKPQTEHYFDNGYKLRTYVETRLPFSMVYQPANDETSRQILGTAYLADQNRWDAAADRFLEIDLAAKSALYDYLFRKLSRSARIPAAKMVSDHMMKSIIESGEQDHYQEVLLLARFYNSMRH